MIYNVNQAQPFTGFRSEEQILRNKCSMIRAQVVATYTERSSAYKMMLKSSITAYLENVGTPIAEQILIEYQRCDFNNIR